MSIAYEWLHFTYVKQYNLLVQSGCQSMPSIHLLSISIGSIDMTDQSIFVQKLIKILIIYMRTILEDSPCSHSNVHWANYTITNENNQLMLIQHACEDSKWLNTVQISLRCYLGWNGIISKPIGIFTHIIIPVYEWMRKYARARACMGASRAHWRPIKENQRHNSIGCLQSKLMYVVNSNVLQLTDWLRWAAESE